jgi:two-component system cell cycle sensor histidine kinase/response regulator CckA
VKQDQLVEPEALRQRVSELEQERLRLEAQVLLAQNLACLDVLARGIAHDVNNFLSGVLVNTTRMLRKLDQDSPLVPVVQEIKQAAKHTSETVEEKLPSCGQMGGEVRRLNLSAVVAEMEPLLRGSMAKNAELKLGLDGEIPDLEGVLTEVRQTILNLVMNASQALGDAAGSITVTTEAVEIDSSEPAGVDKALAKGFYAVLEVCDTGKGMDATTREQVFKPFFTTSNSRRGLGLTSVRFVVGRHRGAIRIESQPAQGTSVRVYFRLLEDTPAEAWHSGGAILAIDDDPVVRRLAESVFQDFGFDVLVAEDGLEGLEVFRAHREKIVGVFLDMSMPRLDGTETFRELRRLEPMLKILLSSGYDEQRENVAALLREGGVGFISKPYRPMALMEHLQVLLESETKSP